MLSYENYPALKFIEIYYQKGGNFKPVLSFSWRKIAPGRKKKTYYLKINWKRWKMTVRQGSEQEAEINLLKELVLKQKTSNNLLFYKISVCGF